MHEPEAGYEAVRGAVRVGVETVGVFGSDPPAGRMLGRAVEKDRQDGRFGLAAWGNRLGRVGAVTAGGKQEHCGEGDSPYGAAEAERASHDVVDDAAMGWRTQWQ